MPESEVTNYITKELSNSGYSYSRLFQKKKKKILKSII